MFLREEPTDIPWMDVVRRGECCMFFVVLSTRFVRWGDVGRPPIEKGQE